MNNSLSKELKAVIFDVDNTLIASNDFVFENIKMTVNRLQQQGNNIPLPSDEEIIKTLAKNLPFEEIFQSLFADYNWEEVLADYRTHAKDKPYKAAPGAVEAVNKLLEKGIIVGLVTNRVKMLDERLKQAGFNTEKFAFMCMPPAPEFRKPHPRAFEEAIKMLAGQGIHVDQTIMVGDHPDDYYSAFYQNIKFVGVISGYSTRQDFLDCGLENELIIDDLSKLEEVINRAIAIHFYKRSLDNTSALDGRYASTSFPLRHYFSEYALHKNRVKAEIEHLIALSEHFDGNVIRTLSQEEIELLRGLYLNFSAREGYEVLQYDHLSRKGIGPTEHDVKSCELWIREKLENTTLKDVVPMVHMFVTSEDINNLAYKSMLAGAVNDVFTPSVLKITDLLAKLAQDYLEQPVMARTHMQPASPTTFGKIFGNYLSRLINGLTRLNQIELKGKVNGAVGNYNAFTAAYPDLDWLGYSKELTKRLGFDVDLWTDQRGPHTDMIGAFQAIQEIGNVIRDLAADLSIYGALKTMYFAKVESHVGSSVMPHKINPWFAEVAEGNVKKGNYLINCFTNEMDVSRLQRDLSDHDYERSYGEAMGYVLIGIEHLIIALNLTRPDVEFAKQELQNNPQVVTEGIQTILRKHGIADAYNLLKQEFRGAKTDLDQLKKFINEMNVTQEAKKEILNILNPADYLGLAIKLAQEALNKYETFKKNLPNKYLKLKN
ncbi:HAD hydrolase-like protein [Patescibacteria group bacterium]|nr:HAD hydrolase-like protein [Patescibacteria group bacterium]